jgi:hypothetical protein
MEGVEVFWKKFRWPVQTAVVVLGVTFTVAAPAPAFAAHQGASLSVARHKSPALHSPGGSRSKAPHAGTTRVHLVRIGKPQVALQAGGATATRFAVGSSAIRTAASCAYPQLCYNGGPVQVHPHVYLLLWGTWWYCLGSGCVNCPTSSTGCGSGNSRTVESYLYYYWHQVGAQYEGWSTITSQYYGSAGQHPTFGHNVWGTSCSTDGNHNCGWVAWQQNPPASPTTTDLANMATTAANYFGVQNDPGAEIVVLTPSRIRPYLNSTSQFPSGNWCAYHTSAALSSSSNLSYTVMPWLPNAGNSGSNCWSGSSTPALTNGFSKESGHEFTESVTDPVPGTGYYTADPSDPNNTEIGDRCNNNTFTETMPDGSQYFQQELWSNVDKTCVQSMPVGPIKGYQSKCIDNSGGHAANGNKIDIWGCNGTAAQLIWYTPSSGHLIVDSGCLDVQGGSHNPGTPVIWYHCGTGANQKWQYDSSSHQWQVYRGVLGLGAMCLEDPGSSTTNGTQLVIDNCNSGANQKWTMPTQ